jgi:hypothetical protein
MDSKFIEQGGLTFTCHENGKKYNSTAIEQKGFGVIGHIIDLEGETAYRILRAMNDRDELLEALENLENDDGGIPDHAWKMVQAAIARAKRP